MDPVEIIILYVGVPLIGFFMGGLLLARLISWLRAVVTAHRLGDVPSKLPLAMALHSAPWLLAGIGYWAYHVLSSPHGVAWDWFFAAMLAAFPVLITVSALIDRRNRKT